MRKLLCITTIMLLSYASNAQIIKTKLDLVGGLSAREYLHGGLKYQYSDITQVGFNLGYNVFVTDERITTYCLDHQIHFGNISYNSNRPIWYARQGFTYSVNKRNIVSNDNITAVKYSYINLALGREFPVNDWLGFNADFGIVWQVRKYREGLESPIVTDDFIMPLARVQMFISL